MLLVDAANVVGSRPDGWWTDRPAAASRLVAALRRAATSDLLPLPVVVVLEGQARAGEPEGEVDGVRVVHAVGSGDDALAALAGQGVTLVSADRELRARAQQLGAAVLGPRRLWEVLDRVAG